MTKTLWHIRPGQWEDRETIARFNQGLAQETEDLALPYERVLAGVSGLLQEDKYGFYLVAVHPDEGDVVGQLAVTYEWSDWRNGLIWWIQSVYVHPEHRRQGVYSSLYRHLQQRAEQDPGVSAIRLYIERHNHTARATYQRVGMYTADYDVMEVDFVIDRPESWK